MTELEIAELERNLAENDSYNKEERSAAEIGGNLGEEVRDVLTALEADEEISNLEEEEVIIIEEIAEALERIQIDKLPALRDIAKKKLLEKTAKVDKYFCKFKTRITKTNELFYAGAAAGSRKKGSRKKESNVVEEITK